MRFGLVHRILVDTLAALGLLALIACGELSGAVSVLLVVAFGLALLLSSRFADARWIRGIALGGPVIFIGLQTLRLFGGQSPLPIAIESAAGLQILRLASRRGAAHDHQIIVLALFHVIVGAMLGTGLLYAICLAGYILIAPSSLVLSHLRREVEGNYRQGARDRTGLPVDVPRILRSRRVIDRPFLIFTSLLAVPILCFTVILFVTFPRSRLSLLGVHHGNSGRVVGFSDRVDLGGVGKLASDPTVVLRVELPKLQALPPPRLALYLRGASFDTYRGNGWFRTLPTPPRLVEQLSTEVRLTRYPDPARDRTLIVDLDPIDPPVLFLPSDAVAVTILSQTQGPVTPRIFASSSGTVSYKSVDERGIRYSVSLADARDHTTPAPLSKLERERFLALPQDFDGAIVDLAERWVHGLSDPAAQAKFIENQFRTQFQYDLESPSGSAKNPLYHFLFHSRRGHCEFYSTAMALMLRSLGIPARNVTGFASGTYNRFAGYYVVRQSDAHSWVEAYFEDRGWLRFDPTPASDAAHSAANGVFSTIRDAVEAFAQRYHEHVLSYDHHHQIRALRALQDSFDQTRQRLRRHPEIAPLLGSALALLGFAGVAVLALRFWRRRKQRFALDAAETPADTEVIALYRRLESALNAHGVPRASGTPPLKHAETLSELGHPIGHEVLSLTQAYLRTRFGAEVLSPPHRDEFERRIQSLELSAAQAQQAQQARQAQEAQSHSN